ncbi:hypothetical protein, partial [Frankia sp. CiP1_Cm_nod1]|uniref:hypothetical protein n=1 Tax=Frankia sp. CiP1_Cm_nod1 TaxID=2897160 RepID=UPI002023D0B3
GRRKRRRGHLPAPPFRQTTEKKPVSIHSDSGPVKPRLWTPDREPGTSFTFVCLGAALNMAEACH